MFISELKEVSEYVFLNTKRCGILYLW